MRKTSGVKVVTHVKHVSTVVSQVLQGDKHASHFLSIDMNPFGQFTKHTLFNKLFTLQLVQFVGEIEQV